MVPLLIAATLALAQPPPVAAPVIVIPPATVDEALEIGGETVAARAVRGRLAVPVHIDDRGPYRFVVDSGADRSVVGAGVAARLGLEDAGAIALHGITGTARVPTVHVARLRVGGSTIEAMRLPALREADLGADGLLGIDALADQRLLLDFDRRSIAIEDSRRPAIARDGEIVVVARRRHGQLILTEVTVAGHRVDAVIDTGSEITVGNLALATRLRRSRRATPATTEIVGVTGETRTVAIATLDDLRVARLRLSNVVVAFADLPPFGLFGLADRPALLLGTDVLEAFRRVSLDFRRRRVRFQLRP